MIFRETNFNGSSELSKKDNINFFLFSVLILTIFSIYQINYEDLWFDELLTFSLTDPAISNNITYKNVLFYEGIPPLYFFLIKYFFKLFGYDPEFLRYPNVIFNTLALLFFFQILLKISNNKKFIFLGLCLFSMNYFIISYAKEGRVYILYLFSVLFFINSYLQISFFNKNKKKFFSFFLFILSGVLCLSTHLFSNLIILSMISYELLFKKKNKKSLAIIICFFIILSLYFVLNLDYIKRILIFKSGWITQPDLNFYLFNFFFKQFFGSKIMGYIFFMVFWYSIYLILKKKNIFDQAKFFIIILVLTYTLTIIYGYIFEPILRDRYIIYIVPIIIILISIGLTLKLTYLNNKLIVFLIILSFLNLVFKIYKSDIHKPEFTSLINEIQKNSKEKKIFFHGIFYDSENKFYNDMVKNYLIHKNFNNIKLISETNINKKNIWLICYDPTNVFDKCLQNTKFNVKKIYPIKTIKKHQIASYLLN